MKCEKCKSNEADIFVGFLNNDRQKKISLCEFCSHTMGTFPHQYKEYDDKISQDMNVSFSVSYQKQCSYCKTDISQILPTGQVGCPHCYSVFKKEINRFFSVRTCMDRQVDPVSGTVRDQRNELIEN